ncbi:MAG: hypothetical protein U0401_30705 [Anaerolineae bacterium]
MNSSLSPAKLSSGVASEKDSATKTWTEDRIVILQPITMRIPNRHGVYSPSKFRAKKEIRYEEFLEQYADHSRRIRVCFDETPSSTTIFQRSELITAYGSGLDCWYIIEPYNSLDDPSK